MSKKKETLWDVMFTESDKEKEIQSRIDAERKEYEASPEYIAHDEKMDALYNELNEAYMERVNNAKEYRKERFPRRVIDFSKETKEQREKRIADAENAKKERIAKFPETLQKVIEMYSNLSDDEKRMFCKEAVEYGDSKLDDMENKQITHEQTRQLQDILVQTCIDFINEHGLKDVDAVYFSADALQSSAKYNKWVPDTDSFLTLEGMEKSKKNGGFYVRKFIDKSF